jgi:hypothetical protein
MHYFELGDGVGDPLEILSSNLSLNTLEQNIVGEENTAAKQKI